MKKLPSLRKKMFKRHADIHIIKDRNMEDVG